MHSPQLEWNPPRRQLRYLAWLIASVLAVLAWQGDPVETRWLRLAAASVFAVGTVLPGFFRWPYVALLYLIYPFLWLIGRTPVQSSHSRKRRIAT